MPTTVVQQLGPQQKRRGGAPLGNTNRARHGLKGALMPKGCERIGRFVNQFRRQLESEVLDARGEITLVDAAYINTAFRAERHAQLAQRWLAREAELMTAADRLNYSREVVRASAERDKAIAALGLPKRPSSDPWGALQSHRVNGNGTSQQIASTPVQVTTSPDNAAAGRVGGDTA